MWYVFPLPPPVCANNAIITTSWADRCIPATWSSSTTAEPRNNVGNSHLSIKFHTTITPPWLRTLELRPDRGRQRTNYKVFEASLLRRLPTLPFRPAVILLAGGEDRGGCADQPSPLRLSPGGIVSWRRHAVRCSASFEFLEAYYGLGSFPVSWINHAACGPHLSLICSSVLKRKGGAGLRAKIWSWCNGQRTENRHTSKESEFCVEAGRASDVILWVCDFAAWSLCVENDKKNKMIPSCLLGIKHAGG